MTTGEPRRDRVVAGACIECGGWASAACPHCGGTGREPLVEQWFYMSFADATLPTGSQFLGGCYVQALSPPLALAKTHELGINPGGEVRVAQCPDDILEATVAPGDRHRLLTRDEITAQ